MPSLSGLSCYVRKGQVVVPEAVKDVMLIVSSDAIPILVSSSFEGTVALAGLTNALLSGQEYAMAQTSLPTS